MRLTDSIARFDSKYEEFPDSRSFVKYGNDFSNCSTRDARALL
jgi:hypothetical protein